MDEQTVTRRKPGRVPMSDDVGTAIMDAYEGGLYIRDACSENHYSPAAWYEWVRKDEARVARYEALKQARARDMAESLGALTQGVMAGAVDPERLSGPVVNSIKWMASVYAPKEFGERQSVTHKVERAPTAVEQSAASMSDDEALALLHASRKQVEA